MYELLTDPLRSQYLDGALHAYGHPGLLAVAEALNGPDFTPFTESSFYKQAGFGTSTACDLRRTFANVMTFCRCPFGTVLRLFGAQSLS